MRSTELLRSSFNCYLLSPRYISCRYFHVIYPSRKILTRILKFYTLANHTSTITKYWLMSPDTFQSEIQRPENLF